MSVGTRLIPSNETRVSTRGLGIAALQASYLLVIGFVVILTYYYVRGAVRADFLGYDFEGTLWDPGLAIREGRSPYPAPIVAEVEVGNPAVYPPLLMLAVAPLTILPWAAGAAIWSVLLVGAVAGTLFVVGVRDLRCYALALASTAVATGVVFGNATLLLVPLVALAWRWRDMRLRTGIVVGLAIASKLFLWPLLFWLLGTRRYPALGAALAVTVLGILVPWATIGFDGFTSYPDLLRVAEDVYAAHSFSVSTMLSALGVETQLAGRGALAVGLALAAGALYAGRRSADATSASLAVLAAILGSPIVWPYYYALLLVPLAIARPRFSGLWVAFALFWVVGKLPRERLDAADLAPGGTACCRPDDVPAGVWNFNHGPPVLWLAAGNALLAVALVTAAVVIRRRDRAAP